MNVKQVESVVAAWEVDLHAASTVFADLVSKINDGLDAEAREDLIDTVVGIARRVSVS